MLTIRFCDAIVTTHEIHVSQLRKGTTIPYIAHLLGFTSIALQHGAGEDEATAALLHDSIEDAPDHLGAAGVRRLLRERFGERVLCIVEACTDTDVRPKPEWRVRKETYVLHLANESDASVLLVSASDKLHNAGAILWEFRPSANTSGTGSTLELERRTISATTAAWLRCIARVASSCAS
jgi:(p)ppGpp synthase/HD superfamily hydrolase